MVNFLFVKAICENPTPLYEIGNKLVLNKGNVRKCKKLWTD